MTYRIEVERQLALFSQGIQARLPTFSDDDSHQYSFNLSDYINLSLPDFINHFTDRRTNEDVFRWQVLQQLAFWRYGTFKFDIHEAIQKLPQLRDHEVQDRLRTPHLELFFNCFTDPKLAERIFHVVESARVREKTFSEFPGSKRLYQLHLKTQSTGSSIEGTSTLLTLAHLEKSLNSPNTLTATWISLVGQIFSPNSTVYDAAQATTYVYSILETRLAKTPNEVEIESESEIDLATLQRGVKLEELKEELNELDASLLALSFAEEGVDNPDGMVGNVEDGSIREQELANLEKERNQVKRLVDMESSLLSQYNRSSVANQPHFRYDEWNYLEQSWLRKWCKVFEIVDEVDVEGSTSDLLSRVKPYVPAVRKQFEQVKPAGMRRVNRVIDGDEINLDAMIEVRSDIKANSTPDDRVYSRIDRLRRDVSACLLVDLSASTDDPVQAEDPSHMAEDDEDPFDDPYLHGINFDPDQKEKETPRKIVDIQKEAVLLLATALEDLGDLYSVYGFSGYGHECVEIHVAKDFNSALTGRSVQAIAAMKPLRSTRMGPAIRHATHRLLETGTTLNVLIVISDGFPQDSDYGPDRSDHEYGIQDTAMAIREASMKGVHVFCITVDLSGHDYLKRMCEEDQYLVIEETDQLPQALHQVYRQMTS